MKAPNAPCRLNTTIDAASAAELRHELVNACGDHLQALSIKRMPRSGKAALRLALSDVPPGLADRIWTTLRGRLA